MGVGLTLVRAFGLLGKGVSATTADAVAGEQGEQLTLGQAGHRGCEVERALDGLR
jgi:hypothetical protein